MAAYLVPEGTQQRTFNTDEISRRADPEWTRDRNYTPAYKFSNKRKFIDHRDNVYDEPVDFGHWPDPIDPLPPVVLNLVTFAGLPVTYNGDAVTYDE